MSISSTLTLRPTNDCLVFGWGAEEPVHVSGYGSHANNALSLFLRSFVVIWCLCRIIFTRDDGLTTRGTCLLHTVEGQKLRKVRVL
jgi:hypothetical protein